MEGRTGSYVSTALCAAMHFLVDGLCVCCLYLAASASFDIRFVVVFVAYNVLAFLTQPLTGHWADRMKQRHWMLLASVVLLALGVLAASMVVAFKASVIGLMAVAALLGLGNSLFHVWGGKQVALRTANDIRALGVFVSTGAMGLAVGYVFYSWVLLYVILLAVSVLAVVYLRVDGTFEAAGESPAGAARLQFSPMLIGGGVVALMAVVMLRSYVGEGFSSVMAKGSQTLLLIGLVSMLGKMAGGWLAKGLGIITSMTIVVLGVIACRQFSTLNSPFSMALAGLFLVNCTMPVTLYLANMLLKRHEGLSFGLLAAALMPGYLLAVDSTAFSPFSSLLPPLLLALVPTIVIELGVLLMLRERRRRVLQSSVLVNVLTNVPLNLLVMKLGFSLPLVIGGELVVILVEALWYRLFVKSWTQAFTYSLLCNAISFLTGVLVQLLF